MSAVCRRQYGEGWDRVAFLAAGLAAYKFLVTMLNRSDSDGQRSLDNLTKALVLHSITTFAV